jgi:2-dehydro-3-deoxygalactonokinase
VVYQAVDTGTSNTTVWLLKDDRILGQVREPVGVRNACIRRAGLSLPEVLRDSLRQLSQQAGVEPDFVLAAGMITSSLGLLELPHVVAPAGLKELSRSVRMEIFPHISPLPFFFVPGVRIRPAPCQLGVVENTDVIRGEETEIVGLLAQRAHPDSWVLLHLGSHTKAIHVDRKGRIVHSVTTLSGECLELFRTQTILATQLSDVDGAKLKPKFLDRGNQCALRHGISRALFMIRLLGENPEYGPAELYSFLLGASVATDLKAFDGLFREKTLHIVLSGHPALVTAWKQVLHRWNRSVTMEIIRPENRVAAFLTGLRRIVLASPSFRAFRVATELQMK